MTAYTNTVLEKTYAATTTTPWEMFLYPNQTPLDTQITLYGQGPGPTYQLTELPTTDWDIVYNPLLPEQFEIAWTPPPGPGAGTYPIIVIFRRVFGQYDPFLPGGFLSAEALNLRFNLLTLATNDLSYYQRGTIPRYKAEAIINNNAGTALDGMKGEDLDLPYLGTGGVFGDVWIWGKQITDTPNPGDGQFVPVLFESAGSGTLPQFKNELLQGCPAPTAGANLVHCCVPGTSFGGPSMSLQQYIGEALPYNANAATAGANQIGLYIDGGAHIGATNVSDFCNELHYIGVPPYTGTAGASHIGYGGWGISSSTVAGCLSRLNGAATSYTDSGANHVQYWDGAASRTMQSALQYHTLLVPTTAPNFNSAIVNYTGFPGIFNNPTEWTRMELDLYQGGIHYVSTIPFHTGGLTGGQTYLSPCGFIGPTPSRFELQLLGALTFEVSMSETLLALAQFSIRIFT